MRELWKDNNYSYLKLEEAKEVDNFLIEGIEDEESGFDFFKGLGIVGYSSTFKAWLRKFPRPIFLVAVKDKRLVSWMYVEEWEEPANDGFPVYVLRAVETLPGLRGKRIGLRLFLLMLKQTAGYVITKPITPEARRFFEKLGFKDETEMHNPPIDLSHRSSYLVFPVYKRREVLEDFEGYLS
ncbi:MAG: N-acetyltransferase [Methanomassiliicoccales archaeon]|nr:MAG: N-acetyltransferase [Methanomassiliicoccales archaeon]